MAFRLTSKPTNGYGKQKRGFTAGSLGRKISGKSSNIGVKVRGKRGR